MTIILIIIKLIGLSSIFGSCIVAWMGDWQKSIALSILAFVALIMNIPTEIK
jgi:hypothetical protein